MWHWRFVWAWDRFLSGASLHSCFEFFSLLLTFGGFVFTYFTLLQKVWHALTHIQHSTLRSALHALHTTCSMLTAAVGPCRTGRSASTEGCFWFVHTAPNPSSSLLANDLPYT